MCTSQAEGGRRCAAYWRERSLRFPIGTPEWDEAAAQAAISPRVRESYLYGARVAETEDHDLDRAAALRAAARRGEELEARNREMAAEESRVRAHLEASRASTAFTDLASRLPDGWTYEPVSLTHGHVRGTDAAGHPFSATAQVRDNHLTVKWFGTSGTIHETTDSAPWYTSRITSLGGTSTLHIPLDPATTQHHMEQAQTYLAALAADRFTYFGDNTLAAHSHALTRAAAAWENRHALTDTDRADLRDQVRHTLSTISQARPYEEGPAAEAFATTLHQRPIPDTDTAWDDRLSDALGLAPLALDQAATSPHHQAALERGRASNQHHRDSMLEASRQADLDRHSAAYATASAARSSSSGPTAAAVSDPWASR